MMLSLAVVMAGVLLFVIFVMPRGGDEQPIKVVDTSVSLSSFARQAPYRVLAPAGLPAQLWKPTSIRATLPTGGTGDGEIAEITIGYVIDRKQDHFARFSLSNAPDAVHQLLGDRPVTGSTVLDGVSWQERRDEGGHLALTRTVAGVTAVVDDGAGAGAAGADDLATLAGSLRPVPAAEPTS
jgi:Protein of unknown function (DUF4245)